MALTPYFLAATSVLAREAKPVVAERLVPLREAGLVARTAIADLEMGRGARNHEDWLRQRRLLGDYPLVAVTPATLERASEVQGLLTRRSQHRGVKVPDLLVAAAAEATGLVVLHYDGDFDAIAAVSGQEARWVVPPGSTS